MRELLADLYLGARSLCRRPARAAIAALTLTLGIGANTAIFAVISGVLLETPPGVEDAGRLAELTRAEGRRALDVSYPLYDVVRRNGVQLEGAAAWIATRVSVGDGADAAARPALSVTGNYFALLGVRPALGRWFAEEESWFPAVSQRVVVSDRLWRESLDADPAAVGRSIVVNGRAFEVAAVTPHDFRGHAIGANADVYLLLGAAAPGLQSAESLRDPDNDALQVLARLRGSLGRAEVERALTADVRQALGARQGEPLQVRLDEYSPVPSAIRDAVVALLSILLAVSALLLALAASNVASLTAARMEERHGEIAVRRALGASRGRVLRLLLAESVVLHVAAGVAGTLVAALAAPLVTRLQPPLPPGMIVDLAVGVTSDWRLLLYSLPVSIGAGLLFGLGPALAATRTQLAATMQQATASGARRPRGTRLGVQVGITVVLLSVCTLLLRALEASRNVASGWDATDVHVAFVDVEPSGASEDQGRVTYDEILRRVAAVPGVEAVSLAGKLPFAGRSSLGPARAAGSDPSATSAAERAFFNRVSPGYFRTMRVRLLAGRDFGDLDHAGAEPVAIVNRAMADRLWPGRSAIGERFTVGVGDGAITRTVVGVAENTKYHRLVEEVPSFYFLPVKQWYNAQMILQVRTLPGAGSAVLDAVRHEAAQAAPAVPAEPLQPLADALEVFFLPQRVAAWVSGVLGALGLLLGAIGVHGMAMLAVARRTREIGIRMALGGRPAVVLWLLIRQTLVAPVIGATLGSVVALVAGQALLQRFGLVSAVDPVAFLLVLAGLGAVVGFATFVPARAATRLEPARTLRSD